MTFGDPEVQAWTTNKHVANMRSKLCGLAYQTSKRWKISPKFLCPNLLDPLGLWTSPRSSHGCLHPNAYFPRLRGPARSFWPRTSARMTMGRPRAIRPENFLFGLFFFRSWPDARTRFQDQHHHVNYKRKEGAKASKREAEIGRGTTSTDTDQNGKVWGDKKMIGQWWWGVRARVAQQEMQKTRWLLMRALSISRTDPERQIVGGWREVEREGGRK